MDRRSFLKLVSGVGVGLVTCRLSRGVASPGIMDTVRSIPAWFRKGEDNEHLRRFSGRVMTVTGDVAPTSLGTTLAHECLLWNPTAPADVPNDPATAYDENAAFKTLLSGAMGLVRDGVDTIIEGTPAYMGRNPSLLRRLSNVSGVKTVTSTGVCGTNDNRYVPAAAFSATVEDLAFQWIREAWFGIGENGAQDEPIRPGFIQIGVDAGGLSSFHGKLFKAAALAHLQTGLPIMVQSADTLSIYEGITLLKGEGVSESCLIWGGVFPAQKEDVFPSSAEIVDLAKSGVWVCLNKVRNSEDVPYIVQLLDRLKSAKLLDRVLLSQSQHWIVENGGEKPFKAVDGGTDMFRALHEHLFPALQKAGFSSSEIKTFTKRNPQEAFAIGLRKR